MPEEKVKKKKENPSSSLLPEVYMLSREEIQNECPQHLIKRYSKPRASYEEEEEKKKRFISSAQRSIRSQKKKKEIVTGLSI